MLAATALDAIPWSRPATAPPDARLPGPLRKHTWLGDAAPDAGGHPGARPGQPHAAPRGGGRRGLEA
eukprot:15478435-Alexandrium_andersonii.AAC.1